MAKLCSVRNSQRRDLDVEATAKLRSHRFQFTFHVASWTETHFRFLRLKKMVMLIIPHFIVLWMK